VWDFKQWNITCVGFYVVAPSSGRAISLERKDSVNFIERRSAWNRLDIGTRFRLASRARYETAGEGTHPVGWGECGEGGGGEGRAKNYVTAAANTSALGTLCTSCKI
jgi:hypothetical protein